jgi:hypothetical protein
MRAMKRKRGERGAVFVEALIVVSVFTILFLGVLFFRDLYMQQMRTQRLARAGALHNAMGACEESMLHDLEEELRGLPTDRQVDEEPEEEDPADAIPDSDTNSRGKEVYGAVAAADGVRGPPLMRITTLKATGEASVTTRSGPDAPEQGFRGKVGSGSYVACGDAVNNKQYGGLASYVAGIFDQDFPQ